MFIIANFSLFHISEQYTAANQSFPPMAAMAYEGHSTLSSPGGPSAMPGQMMSASANTGDMAGVKHTVVQSECLNVWSDCRVK